MVKIFYWSENNTQKRCYNGKSIVQIQILFDFLFDFEIRINYNLKSYKSSDFSETPLIRLKMTLKIRQKKNVTLTFIWTQHLSQCVGQMDVIGLNTRTWAL